MKRIRCGIAEKVYNGDEIVSGTVVCIHSHDVYPTNTGYFCPEEKLLCYGIPVNMQEKNWVPVEIPYSVYHGFSLCHRYMEDGERLVQLTGTTYNGGVVSIRLNENDEPELWNGYHFVPASEVPEIILERLG